MCVMTVILKQASNGRVSFETSPYFPHQRGKFIAGFAHDEADAIRRVKAYAGEDVTYMRQMSNVQVSGGRRPSDGTIS